MFYGVIMYKCCTDLNANILTNASDSVNCFTTKKLGTTVVSQILHQMEHYITLELLNNTSPLNRKRRLKQRSYLISKLYKILDLLFHLCDKLQVFSETQAEQSCSFSAAVPLSLKINPNMASHNRHHGAKQISDLASSLRLSLYAEVERTLKGSEDESICNASAKRLFLSKVAHS